METTTSTLQFPIYDIIPTANGLGFIVNVGGTSLTDTFGNTRVFASRASARKTITRLRRSSGDRHR